MPLNIPVFAGQGTAAANSEHVFDQAVLDASSPTGTVLLSACFEAFRHELSSLSSQEVANADVDASDYSHPKHLLEIPRGSHLANTLITTTRLFLLQILRYNAFVESYAGNSSLFSSVLKDNAEQGLGILGFSSGLLPAYVVGSSTTFPAYLNNAVETYRLAFWIGLRMQLYSRCVMPSKSVSPWSIVVLGMNRESATEAIKIFDYMCAPSLFVVAVMSNACVSIAGHPNRLDAFRRTLDSRTTVQGTSVDSLFHCPAHAGGVRESILNDVCRRKISLPSYSDIKFPFRSTLDGKILMQHTDSRSPIEFVIDMIVVQPVNWDFLTADLLSHLPAGFPARILNFGPGLGIARIIEKTANNENVSIIDLTTSYTDGQYRNEPIAIVGMDVHMPSARDPVELWEVLEKGINTISEIPVQRFSIKSYGEAGDSSKNRMSTSNGNFIDGVDEFDNYFFKISPREAKSMDPQQRILLQTAYRALENSGYVPDSAPSFEADQFGCYVGGTTHDYIHNLHDEIDMYYTSSSLNAFLSGRVSYTMKLSGPSITVDTACSSSATAIYQGCRAILNGDCRAALVGGINIIASPDTFVGLDRGHFLSPTGQCKPFDASADGYARSEGCGMFVIKRLSDAISENDNILGIIRGIEINQSGLASSLTHPHAPTQVNLFKKLLQRTGMNANRINVVEAHGTGTQAGDPTEMSSLRTVLSRHRSPRNPLHITSIKANVGHLEAASGSASLAKILLMFRHKRIPPMISFKTLNPDIAPLQQDHTILDTSLVPWNSFGDKPRVALLNNFGASGSNVAILVEEHRSVSHKENDSSARCFTFGLSAKTESALHNLRGLNVAWLKKKDNVCRIGDVSYTMLARRQICEYRLSCCAYTKDELARKLQAAPIKRCTDIPLINCVFVFSGLGGQNPGMGRDLYESSKVFKAHINECHEILISSGFSGILAFFEHGDLLPSTSEEEMQQILIFALEYALARLWISWGLRPSAVVGHSLGEYAALAIADVLSVKDALIIVAQRSRLVWEKCAHNSTGMIAVKLNSDTIDNLLKSSDEFSGLSIACYNSPSACVISGSIAQLHEFQKYLDDQVHCQSIILSIPFGFHSRVMSPIVDDLLLFTEATVLQPPTIPFVSSHLGAVIMPKDGITLDHNYFARHCEGPIRFYDGINALIELSEFSQVDVWLEIGPHSTTLSMLKSNVSVSKESKMLASLKIGQGSWTTMSSALSQLYLLNSKLHWRKVFVDLSVSCIDLPSYPFAKSKFWIPYKELDRSKKGMTASKIVTRANTKEFSLLRSWKQWPERSNRNVAIFETPISYLAKSILGHRVGGVPLCPASLYLEQAMAGAELAQIYLTSPLEFDGIQVVLRDIRFLSPLVYDEMADCNVVVVITIFTNDHSFNVGSQLVDSSEITIHAQGTYRFKDMNSVHDTFAKTYPMVARQMNEVVGSSGERANIFSTRTIYEVIFSRVVDYAKEYHTMQSVTVATKGMEGVAEIMLPQDHGQGKYVVHPVFLDSLIHVPGFLANMQGSLNEAYICNEIGTINICADLVDNDLSYTVYCNIVWLEGEGVMLGEAFAISNWQPRKIIAHLKNMRFRRVRLDFLRKSLIFATSKPSRVSLAFKAPQNNVATGLETHPNRLINSSVHGHASDVVEQIIKIIADTSDVNPSTIDVTTGLASIGIDSLLSIEVLRQLQSTFPRANLSIRKLSACQSIHDISSIIESSATLNLSKPQNLYHPPRIDPHAVQTKVLAILCEILDIEEIEVDCRTDLRELGVDSLMTIEILARLDDEYPTANLMAKRFMHVHFVSDYVEYIISSQEESTSKLHMRLENITGGFISIA